MAEAHEWTLRRLREMAGRLTEQAYLRASEAAALRDDEAHARWMLVFDRMARGLRLSMALEARLARERRRDAAEIQDEIGREPRGAQPSETGPIETGPIETGPPDTSSSETGLGPVREADSEREADDDGLPDDAPLGERIARLKAIIEGTGAPEPQPSLHRVERLALNAQRAVRARRAASDLVPDEPWDVLGDETLSVEDLASEEAPWLGAG